MHSSLHILYTHLTRSRVRQQRSTFCHTVLQCHIMAAHPPSWLAPSSGRCQMQASVQSSTACKVPFILSQSSDSGCWASLIASPLPLRCDGTSKMQVSVHNSTACNVLLSSFHVLYDAMSQCRCAPKMAQPCAQVQTCVCPCTSSVLI